MSHLRQTSSPSIWHRLAHPAAFVVVIWAIEILDLVIPGQLERFGIRSWDFSSLLGILAAPLLHSDWAHLLGNSGPILILGGIIALESPRRFWLVTLSATLIGGLGTFFINTPGTLTVGASILVFGYFGYIVTRAVAVRNTPHRVRNIIIAVVVVIAYGSAMFSGLLPIHLGISWQAHLFGGLGGVAAALLEGRKLDAAR